MVKYTDKLIIDKIRKLLKDTNEIFRKYNLVYWIDGGTLLGAIRHGDVIPWDDDADICILDENKFVSLKPIFNQYGYDITSFWAGYKIYPINGERIREENRNWTWDKPTKINYKYPFIDVFVCNDEDIIKYNSQQAQKIWNNFYHNKIDLFPLKEYKFNSFSLLGPNNPKPYLDRGYGLDWMVNGYKDYDHLNMKFLQKNKFKI